MSLQFKAYLIKGNPNNVKEIRRFTIDTDVSSNYDYLRNKVSAVFPNIGDTFRLQYKDVEGDFISFSSDEELMQALAQVNDGLFRLFVKTPKCEGNGKKDENGENPCRWRRFNAGGAGQYPHHPPPPFCGPFPHGQPPRCGPPPPRFAFGFGHPWGQDWMQGHFQAQAQHQGPGGEEAQASTSTDTTSGNQQQQQSQGQQQPGAAETATAYLNSVGEAVAGFLKPLGIDVDIDVEHNGKRSKCAESEKKKQEKKKEGQTTGQKKTQPGTEPKSTGEAGPSSPATDTEWTVVQDENEGNTGDMDAEASHPPTESMNIDSPPSFNTGNPRLDSALKQMHDMGFRDDGGWLSHLLEAHDYDITRAVEAMQPGHRA